MARPRRDGTPPRQPVRRKLTDAFIRSLKPDDRRVTAYDTIQRGLAVTIQAKPSGRKAWKVLYFAAGGRPRWYHIGLVDAVGLADARKLASRVMFDAAQGKDPAAERRAERSRGSFEELATQYVEQYAKKRNKSWRQADALVQRHLIPKWGKLLASAVSRSDVRAMMRSIEAPIVANQTLAAASAIFAWAIREEILTTNPCSQVERNETRSRERVLSDSEIPLFWKEFDSVGMIASAALKMVLLTGQRPGEVRHMRTEHIEGNWWTLPGSPLPELDWLGTRQSHRVWLSKPAKELLAEIDGKGSVFGGVRLDDAMRDICAELKVNEKATPHDLRRTFSTFVTRLGFGREALNRVTNHREGGIADIYDRHEYGPENQRIMEAVAQKIMELVDWTSADNVVHIGKRGSP
jgi:integrase